MASVWQRDVVSDCSLKNRGKKFFPNFFVGVGIFQFNIAKVEWMPGGDPNLTRARAQADRAAAQNARIQTGVVGSTKSRPTEPKTGLTRDDIAMKVAGHASGAYGDFMRGMVKSAPISRRIAVRAASKTIPGLLLAGGEIARADDKDREKFVQGASFLGGLAGGALGSGLMSIPLGIGGSEAAGWAAGEIYDRRDDIARAGRGAIQDARQVGRGIADTLQAAQDPGSFRWRAFNHY